jgi:hypothetical protein
MTNPITLNGPVIKKFDATGTLVATYYLPWADTNELSFEKEGETFTIVESNSVVRDELVKGFLPKLNLKWNVYNDVQGNVGNGDGQTPLFSYLVEILSIVPQNGSIQVARNSTSTFFNCIVSSLPTPQMIRNRIATNVSIEFQGTTLYSKMFV